MTLLDLKPHEEAEFLRLKQVFLGYRGSHSHGTYIPHSDAEGVDDVDLMQVYIPWDLDHWFGLNQQKDVIEKWVRHYDTVTYEFRKFVSLLLKCNPNVLGMLYLEPQFYLTKTEEFQVLIDNRYLFSSKVAYHAFSGYAYSQIKRMTAWSKEQDLEPGRGSSKLYATGFMGAKRKALVEKYGFDFKNAAHAIRLMRMGIEFLKTGHLQVDRTNIDADYLIQIKTGQVGLSHILKEADESLPKMAEAKDNSKLPMEPDKEAVNKLVTDILTKMLSWQVVRRANDLKTEQVIATR